MVEYGRYSVSLEQELKAKQAEIDRLLEDIKDFRGGIAVEQAVLKELEAQHEEEAQGALEVIALEDTVLKMMLEDLVRAMKAKRLLQAELEERERPSGRRFHTEPTLPPGFQ